MFLTVITNAVRQMASLPIHVPLSGFLQILKKERNNTILNFSIVRLWSDSEITLCWINASSQRRKIIVANRVEKIQRLTH